MAHRQAGAAAKPPLILPGGCITAASRWQDGWRDRHKSRRRMESSAFSLKGEGGAGSGHVV